MLIILIASDIKTILGTYMSQFNSESVSSDSRQIVIETINDSVDNYIILLNILTIVARGKVINRNLSADEAIAYIKEEYNALRLNNQFCDFDYFDPLVSMLIKPNLYFVLNTDGKAKYLDELFEVVQTCPIPEYKNGVILFILNLLSRDRNFLSTPQPLQKVIESIGFMSEEDRKKAQIPPIILMEV